MEAMDELLMDTSINHFSFLCNSWIYRIRPSVCHTPFEPFHKKTQLVGNYTDEANVDITPNQLRWSPFDIPTEPTDFVEGLHSIAGAGDVGVKHGMAVLVYAANKSMDDTAFYNSDGDFLIGMLHFLMPLRHT